MIILTQGSACFAETDLIELLLKSVSPGAKRNEKVISTVLKSLETENSKWKHVEGPCGPTRYKVWTYYSPESEPKNREKILFKWTEYHYGKHLPSHTLKDFYIEVESIINTNNASPHSKCRSSNGDGTHSMSTCTSKSNLISNLENILCYETSRMIVTQTVQKVTSKPNFLGQTTEEIIPSGNVESKRDGYRLVMIVDLGGGEFREYSYWAEEIIPSDEEKAYLLRLFKYVEAQIKNVIT